MNRICATTHKLTFNTFQGIVIPIKYLYISNKLKYKNQHKPWFLSKKMTGITIFYGDNIIRYVVNTKRGWDHISSNYRIITEANFELNLMSKFSNFIINKSFSAINNAARHIFHAICWRTNIYFINILKFRIQVLIISNNWLTSTFSLLTGRHFVNAIVFHKFFSS